MNAPGTPLPNDWQIWQLVDSAFPTGGFAHSGGLEAAWHGGWVRSADDLYDFGRAAVRQALAGGGPFVAHANRHPEDFERADRSCDALLSNHVANRASRVQGAALLATAAHTFDLPALVELRSRVRRSAFPGHLATCFGAVCATLGVGEQQATSLYTFNVLRGVVSSAIRLGVCGPLDGQRMQHRLAGELHGLLATGAASIEDAAQTSPFLELVQGTHDRLYSRLFVS
jgi:urease accessory protein